MAEKRALSLGEESVSLSESSCLLFANQLIGTGDMLSHIDNLITIENDRHQAIMVHLEALRNHALAGSPPRKRPKISDEAYDETSEALRQDQLAVLDQLANKMGLQRLPSLKAVAGRVALRLLARAINDMRSKGKGTQPTKSKTPLKYTDATGS